MIVRISEIEVYPEHLKRVRVEYKLAAREGETLTPVLYIDEGCYYVELKCERGVCAIVTFE